MSRPWPAEWATSLDRLGEALAYAHVEGIPSVEVTTRELIEFVAWAHGNRDGGNLPVRARNTVIHRMRRDELAQGIAQFKGVRLVVPIRGPKHPRYYAKQMPDGDAREMIRQGLDGMFGPTPDPEPPT